MAHSRIPSAASSTARAGAAGLVALAVLAGAHAAPGPSLEPPPRAEAAAVRPRVDLGVAVRASRDTVPRGARLAYAIGIVNRGPSAAEPVVLTNTLPESVSPLGCVASGGGTCRISGRVARAVFGRMPPGSFRTVKVEVRPRPSLPPYPASHTLAGIAWDLKGLVKAAEGSDLWPVTWGPDGRLYTSWGDGGGFGGSEKEGRVSLGFARIEGPAEEFEGVNLWGGKHALNAPTFRGKATGMVSVRGVLHAWVLDFEGGGIPEVRLARSRDAGESWELGPKSFPGEPGRFYPLTFLNFGRDAGDARDGFVYFYGKRWSHGPDPWAGDDSFLARAMPDRLGHPAAHVFFGGRNQRGEPVWTFDESRAVPVLSDPSGVDAPSVVYHPVLRRYLATTAHGAEIQKLSIYEAPEPWGPWRTVAYYDNWGELGSGESLGYAIPTKWLDDDGETFWMVFSSWGELDAFNLVRGELSRLARGAAPGPAGTLLRTTARVRAPDQTELRPADDTAATTVTVVP